RYCHILTFSENRLLVPAFSSTADGQRGTPRRPSADGVTRLPSPLPYVFHLQGIAPKLLTHSARTARQSYAAKRPPGSRRTRPSTSSHVTAAAASSTGAPVRPASSSTDKGPASLRAAMNRSGPPPGPRSDQPSPAAGAGITVQPSS